MSERQIAQTLGWLSIGLGLSGLLAPRAVGALTGVGARTGLMRTVGAREIASGIGLLSARDPTPWFWSRVLGDAMDLLVLGAAAARPLAPARTRSLVSLAFVAGVTAVDVAASLRQSRSDRARAGFVEDFIECSTIVNKSQQECYAFWRRLENSPHFMRIVESVTELDERRSKWVARLPSGKRLEWESRITEDLPGERIAWHSEGTARFVHAGVVTFAPAPGGRGTIVRVTLHYLPPAVPAGRPFSKALGWVPAFEVREDLRRFKQILETGEIATTRGQPSGRRSLLTRLMRSGNRI